MYKQRISQKARFVMGMLLFLIIKGFLGFVVEKGYAEADYRTYTMWFYISLIFSSAFYYVFGLWMAVFFREEKEVQEESKKEKMLLRIIVWGIALLPILYYIGLFFFYYYFEWYEALAPIILICAGISSRMLYHMFREKRNQVKR